MPPVKKASSRNVQRTIIQDNDEIRSPRLDKNLVLAEFMHGIFGKKKIDELIPLLREIPVGFDEEGRSYLFPILNVWLVSAKGQDLSIYGDIRPHIAEHLEEYEQNIRRHLETINRRRDRPVDLTYFQYLAALYTEIYLDLFFFDKVLLENSLNRHVELKVKNDSFAFSDLDLKRLAFWMATGSGKTYLLHINYLQFLHYNRGPNALAIENIILITPTEYLTSQHLAYCQASSIPAEPLQIRGGHFASESLSTSLQVIDIYKLTEEKKGKGNGVSIDTSSLGTKNLMFVDEGHKGSGGKTWNDLRDQLVEDGFRFEYSATFGEAVATGKAGRGNESDLLKIYAKSVLFDYSYKYFYNDGYGKDYWLLNVENTVAWEEEERQIVMLANLLSFYQQKKICEIPEYKETLLKEYHIESPLWIFVGSKVTPSQQDSDILNVVKFLNKIFDDKAWMISIIEDMFEGRCPVRLQREKSIQNLFSKSYPETELPFLHHLRKNEGYSSEQFYTDILNLVFHAPPVPGSLVCENLKGVKDQLALRSANCENPFGVIYVGKTDEFLKLLKEKIAELPHLKIADCNFSEDLFATIKKTSSPINILIGAKKFIEGWDTMRVSSMGLLYVGQSEGTQIIQLFGRGVRLNGKDYSLKRSRITEAAPPQWIHILETLSIFGIEADYLKKFREHLLNEVDKPKVFRELRVKIKISDDGLKRKLLIPFIESDLFPNGKQFTITVDKEIKPVVNLIPQADLITSQKIVGIYSSPEFTNRTILPKVLCLLNWQKIYFDLLQWKVQKNWYNVVFTPATLREIIEKQCYDLSCRKERIDPYKFSDLVYTREIVISILKKYLTEYYHHERNIWTKEKMILTELDSSHNNFKLQRNQEHQILVDVEDEQLFGNLDRLIRAGLSVFMVETDPEKRSPLVNLQISNHLYQPLLGARDPLTATFEIHPAGLNDGEYHALKDLKKYIDDNQKIFNESTQVYVLRNQPKVGVGFPSKSTMFFPDFIVWIIQDSIQHIVFLEPHSTIYKEGGDIRESHKYALATEIKEYQERLQGRYPQYRFTLDSVIVDVTHQETLPGVMEAKNIYGQDTEGRYIAKIFKKVLEQKNTVNAMKNGG